MNATSERRKARKPRPRAEAVPPPAFPTSWKLDVRHHPDGAERCGRCVP